MAYHGPGQAVPFDAVRLASPAAGLGGLSRLRGTARRFQRLGPLSLDLRRHTDHARDETTAVRGAVHSTCIRHAPRIGFANETYAFRGLVSGQTVLFSGHHTQQ